MVDIDARIELEFGCAIARGRNGLVYCFPQYQFLFRQRGHPLHAKPLYAEPAQPMRDHPTRLVAGRRVTELKSRLACGGIEVVTDNVLTAEALAHLSDPLLQSTHEFGSNYVAVYDDVIERTITPRAALETCISGSQRLREIVTYLSTTFEMPPGMIGVTGSSLFTGTIAGKDVDVVFYCAPREAERIEETFSMLRSREAMHAPMFGINWPHRLFHETLGVIDVFLAYTKPEECPIDLRAWKAIDSLRSFDVSIEDVRYGGYSPSVYGCRDADGECTHLIVLGTACRALFALGTRVRGSAMEAELSIGGRVVRSLVIAYPFAQIDGLSLLPEPSAQ